MNAFILVYCCMFLLGCIGGYFLGRYQASILNKIRTLEEQARAPKVEPEKPTVVGGAYSSVRPISAAVSKSQKAGIVEAKTPELLQWEADEELRKLEHSS